MVMPSVCGGCDLLASTPEAHSDGTKLRNSRSLPAESARLTVDGLDTAGSAPIAQFCSLSARLLTALLVA